MSQTTVDSNKNHDISVKLVGTDFHYEPEKKLVFPPKGKEFTHSVEKEEEFISIAVETGTLSKNVLTMADGTKLNIPNGSKQVEENRKNAAKSTRMQGKKQTISEEVR